MNQLSRLSDDQTQAFADWCDACVEPASDEVLLLKAAHVDHLSWMRGLVGAIEDFQAFQQCFCQEVKDAFPQAVKQTGKNGQISFKGLCLVAPAGCCRGGAMIRQDNKRPDGVERWLDGYFTRMAQIINEQRPLYAGFCLMVRKEGGPEISRQQYERGIVAMVMDQLGRQVLNSYGEYENTCRSLGWPIVTPEAFRRRIAKGLDDCAVEMVLRLGKPDNEPLQ